MHYNSEHLQFLRNGYKTLSRRELTQCFNKTFNANQSINSITACLKNYKIKSGRSGHFVKGNAPWNTGTKGLIKVNSGTFKKGSIPANAKPLGHERVCPKDNYVLIKVAEPNPYTGAPTRYRHKHQVIWEQINGPIPKGQVVIFKDGDKRNFAIENLQLINRNQLCRYNQTKLNKLPKELIPTMRQVVDLKMKIFEMESGD